MALHFMNLSGNNKSNYSKTYVYKNKIDLLSLKYIEKKKKNS